VAVAIMAISVVPILATGMIAAVAIVTSLTMPSAHQFAHFLASFLAFIFAELAVAVFVELFDNFLPHFGAGCAVVALLGVAAV
jgi:hypothetical protein